MRRVFRYSYAVISAVFVLGVSLQVFLAGLVVVVGQQGWDSHIGLGHALGIPLILMLLLSYLGGYNRDIKRPGWILFAVYILQADIVIFLRGSLPLVAALHPVLALIDFALGWTLFRRSIGLLKADIRAVPDPSLGTGVVSDRS